VYFAEFSPDGKRILTTGLDNGAQVWDAQSGEAMGHMTHGYTEHCSARFSPDGKRIVTASIDGTARVWDAQTGQPLTSPLRHAAGVWRALFSPDGKRVVTASLDHTARIWDAQTGQPLTQPMQHGDRLTSAQFSPDGKRIVTASLDNTAQVWDAPIAQALPVHLTEPYAMGAQFSPDGRCVVTGLDDGSARVWDAQTGQPLTPPLKHQSGLWDVEFSRDGKRLVTASTDSTARVWDAQTGQPLTRPLQHSNRVATAQFSPDGKLVVTASWDHTARIWDAQTGQPLTEPLRHRDYLRSAQFSPDGKRIVTASWDNTARVWDAHTGQPLTSPLQHLDRVVSAVFSPDGKRIATASSDKTARIWDARTAQPLTGPMQHRDRVQSAQFSPDGKRLVTACEDGTARVWDAQTGQPLTAPLKHGAHVLRAQFSPDGARLVTAIPTTSSVAIPVAFSPDGLRILTASSIAQIWDPQTGLPLTEPLKYVLWPQSSTDGKATEADVPEDSAARVWDVAFVPSKLPDWLLPLAEAISGQRLSKQGALEATSLDRAKTIAQIRQDLKDRPDTEDGVLWGRWLLSDPANRTIAPFSSMTVSTYIENRIKEQTQKSLNEAEPLAFGNVELLQRIRDLREIQVLSSNGDFYACAGQWTNALAQFSQLVPLDPASEFRLGPLLAQNGDLEGYRQHCARALAAFAGTTDANTAERTVKDCLIVPVSGIDLTAFMRLADKAIALGKESSDFPYFEFAKGLAEYRQGHFESAIDWLQKVLSQPGVDFRDAQADLVLGMALYQTGRQAEARVALEKGARITDKDLSLKDLHFGDNWPDAVRAQMLLKEAKGLIR
jgi:WD40 repeat protein